MNTEQIAGKLVDIFVSDPWEFGTECGVGPFLAEVRSAQPDALLLRLEAPIAYRGRRLMTVIARPRHSPGRVDPLLSEGHLATNFAFLDVLVDALSEVTNDVKTGMVPAIGSLQVRQG